MVINKDGWVEKKDRKSKGNPEEKYVKLFECKDPNDFFKQCFEHFKNSKAFAKYIDENGECHVGCAPIGYIEYIQKELAFYRSLGLAA